MALVGPRLAPCSTTMETANDRETGETWGPQHHESVMLERLLQLARSAHREQLSPERREEIRERVLERVEQLETRRRRVRVFVAAASAVVLAGLLLMFARGARSIDSGL